MLSDKFMTGSLFLMLVLTNAWYLTKYLFVFAGSLVRVILKRDLLHPGPAMTREVREMRSEHYNSHFLGKCLSIFSWMIFITL